MNCELLSVGTELLLGDILNTDAQFLSRELAAAGIQVWYQSTVGDNPQRLGELLDLALSRSDVVITSGGLGPTKDDLTKEICCEKAGVPLVLHEESLRRIESFFQKIGRPMVKENKKQAMLPEGGTIFPNEHGTAPGCAVEWNGKKIIMLPGPPRELQPMFRQSVLPYLLQGQERGTLVSHNIHVFGLGESSMAHKVQDLLDQANPTVAPYAKDGESLLRVTAYGRDRAECEALCRPVVEEILERLGDAVYGIDCGSLQARVVELLLQKKKKAATAESCTAGLVSKRITEISGSSAVFDCGIVSYSNEIKEKILGVSHESLAQYGAVSEQVAREMAAGVRRIGGADYGVSVTGIAGPSGATEKYPVGASFVAVTDGTETRVRFVNTGRTGDNREYNRTISASNALDLLRRMLEEQSN